MIFASSLGRFLNQPAVVGRNFSIWLLWGHTQYLEKGQHLGSAIFSRSPDHSASPAESAPSNLREPASIPIYQRKRGKTHAEITLEIEHMFESQPALSEFVLDDGPDLRGGHQERGRECPGEFFPRIVEKDNLFDENIRTIGLHSPGSWHNLNLPQVDFIAP